MSVWESMFLGLLQGLAEFLPISSSGHLVLAGELWDISNNLAFDVFLHVGTLMSVLLIMRREIIAVFRKENRKTFLLLVLASIPTFIIALIVKLFVKEELLNSLLPIGFALTIVLLTLTHFLGKGNRLLTDRYLPPVITGIVQGIAVLPGLSRSGSTVCTLSLFGVKREDCVNFSFLLSIPVIVASALVEGYGAIKEPLSVQWYCIVIGIVVAFVVGCFSIKAVKKLATSNKLVFFAIYLLIPLITSIIVL